ncbi:MAG: hypothetical protein Ct9H300mP23_06230 [Nitrospinota bacterium]|nr:MAG: hypothetical protein Ct9H300mP23_06230 [Nitrospinota bacterium]
MVYKEDDTQFWEDIYLDDDAGWDLGGVTPFLMILLISLGGEGMYCRLRKGYDAVMFLKGIRGYSS